MKRNIMNEAEKLIKAHRRKKRWYQAVTCLAGIVVFCTVYSLILPAITMEKYQCGIEEHTHTQECYDAEGSLICGLEEHVHTDACVRSEETAENGIEETADTTTENTGNAATSEEIETVETAETTESSETADSTETENAGSETENTESDTTQEDTETTVDTGTSETEKTAEKTEDTKTDETAQDTETQEEWEATFQSVELTGKYPEDVLVIAKTQIGYTESTENYVTDEAGEDRGYTRYGQWYGEPYGEWSGMFASFCLHYAGVEGMPLSDDCEEWIKELSKEEYSLYHEASDTEYEPVPGDMVFFDLDGDTKADHTGIISEVNISETENELKTIEGDWEDKVQTVTRSVDDEKILGYGALPEQEKEEEQTEENAQAQDFELSVATESGITVTVSGSGDALPYPADEITVKAQEVTDKSVQELWNQVLEKEDAVSGENFLLDITLWHDEEEIEPTGNVTVVFSGFDTEGYSPKIYHIDEQAEEVTDMNAVLEDSGDISVETDHFSVYAGTAVPEDSKALSGYIGNQLQSGANFHLTGNAWTEQYGSNANLNITQDTVINLNGYTLTISKSGQYFDIQNNATLTIVDSKDITDDEVESSGNQLYGNQASLVDNKLTYYITESTPNGTGTTEVLKQHTVDFSGSGKIACGEASAQVVLVSGGTLKIQGGILQNLNGKHTVCVNSGKAEMAGGLVQGKLNNSESGGGFYINSGGTLDISGGYIAGSTGSNGGGIYTKGTVNMTGGVIAANEANIGGGIYVDSGSLTMSDGVISGNRTKMMTAGNFSIGLGGGVYAVDAGVTVNGGYITNNRADGDCGVIGSGCHGGGGVATIGGKFTMTDGIISGNYSSEAGGGLYVGHYNVRGTEFGMSGGIVAANFAYRSEGGGIRISGGTTATIQKAENGNFIYITNNRTSTENDWGGGGIFVQTNGHLVVYEALITENSAQGFGGGVAACPSGKTLVVNEKGAAIYGNNAYGKEFSGGTGGKPDDEDTLGGDPQFLESKCYQDYYSVKKDGKDDITVVMGEMLGGHAANWSGRIDGSSITIGKTGYATSKWLCGLTSSPSEKGKEAAMSEAGIFITGNSSNIHGGGIMTNGNLFLGDTQNIDVICPALDIEGTKGVMKNNSPLNNRAGYSFALFENEPKLNADGTWNTSGCTQIGTAESGEDGKFVLSTNKIYDKTGQYFYYLVEVPGNEPNPDVVYDKTIYKINATIASSKTEVLGVTFTSYYVQSVTVEKKGENETSYSQYNEVTNVPNSDESYTLTFNGTTFTNKIKPDLKIKLVKVDSADAKKALPGAKFKLKEAESAENGTTATTKADGSVEFTGIQRGVTYYLYEVTPPEGYSGSGPWIIEVGNDENAKIYPAQDVGNGKLEKMPGEEGTQFDVSGTDTSTYTITLSTNISNELITYELPETGGAGTKLYTIGGLLLIMGAGSILLYRSKKGRGGASS